ncbi:MAG: hypothetical protein ACFBSF_00020 [Leptolyngbyaceae cyanobacterium]
MNDWETWARDLSEFVEGAARAAGEWAEATIDKTIEVVDAVADEVEKQISPAIDEWAEGFYSAVEPLEHKLDAETERISEEFAALVAPLINPLADSLEAWLITVTTPVNQTLDPLVNEHTACVGCRHYHGQAYGGNMLVCAMYPYGPDQEKCSDWESTWDRSANNG